MLLDNPFKADARVEKEIKSLIRAGHAVTLFALQDDSLPEKEEQGALTIYRILNPVIKSPMHRGYYKYLATMAEHIVKFNPDIVHCHDHHCLNLGYTVKQDSPNIKLIYDAHEFLAGWPLWRDINGFINRLKGRVVYNKMVTLEQQAIHSCDLVLTVSDSIAEAMINDMDLGHKPQVVRNIPPKFEHTRSSYFHEYFGLSDKTKVLLHSGNIYHSPSRMNMLLRVVKEFNNLALVFVGDSPSVKQFERKTNQTNVYFHPYPPQEEFYNLLPAANFGLVYTWKPTWKSHWLSLPNRIFEYSLAGLPIIATSQPEFKKLGEQFGHIAFFKGDNADSLHKAIEVAIEKEAVFAQNANQIGTKLNWESEAEKLLKLYEKL